MISQTEVTNSGDAASMSEFWGRRLPPWISTALTSARRGEIAEQILAACVTVLLV